MKQTSYTLRYAKAQEFYGYQSPAAVLTAMADFDNTIDNRTLRVSLHWTDDEGQYGGTLIWEDV